MYMCMYINACLYIYMHMFIYIYVYTYIYMYIYMHLFFYMYVYIYIHVHIRTHVIEDRSWIYREPSRIPALRIGREGRGRQAGRRVQDAEGGLSRPLKPRGIGARVKTASKGCI